MREHNIQNIAHLSYYTNANGLLLVVLKKRGSANTPPNSAFATMSLANSATIRPGRRTIRRANSGTIRENDLIVAISSSLLATPSL